MKQHNTTVELPVLGQPTGASRLPRWLKRNVPKGNANHFTAALIDRLALPTVCDHARCPNRMECYSQKTATFMILGDVCTRKCGFCSVQSGQPAPVAPDEPERLADAAAAMGLRHVVITSVTRDDLPDGGADHFYQCVTKVRSMTGASVEVLTPDFQGNRRAVDRVLESQPDVFNHNTETVPRLYRRVRGRQSDYQWTLALFEHINRHAPQLKTKSGLMLGLGETTVEVLDVLADLLDHGCDYLTLGQYLQPDPHKYLPVERYVHPDEFDDLGRRARSLGFENVASGPFVRSSYHAREMLTPAAVY